MIKPTSPSDLNIRISIIRVVSAVDVTLAANIWAKKTTHRSDEAVQAMATTGTAIHNFQIRYRPDVRSKDIVKEGNKRMAIIGPPVEKWEGLLRYLDITAKEVA